jgi:hypothetical protein
MADCYDYDKELIGSLQGQSILSALLGLSMRFLIKVHDIFYISIFNIIIFTKYVTI